MAITFLQQKRKQQHLTLVFIGAILLILVVVWKGLLSKPETPPLLPEPVKPPEVKINFEVLQNTFLEELKPLEEIPPFEETAGRENPFIPYK